MKVLVGGVFNVLHPGHIHFLEKARELGDELVVVLATDETVLREKGVLVLPAEGRKMVLESLKLVDKVLIGDDNDKLRVVEKEKPDLIALGYNQDVDARKLERDLRGRGLRCRVVRIKSKLPGYSTTDILEKIRKKKGGW